MANFAAAIRNPIDDPTTEELVEFLSSLGETRDDLEMLCHHQLLSLIADWRF